MAWNTDNSSNRIAQSYIRGFIDISGSLLLRENSNIYIHGNATIGGNLLLSHPVFEPDMNFNNRVFIGGDASMNGNVYVGGDLNISGKVVDCSFNENSIPQSAFNGTISSTGPDYAKPSIIYEQKFQANQDVSMNGTTVYVNDISVNGNIKFSDGTTMNSYNDNAQPATINVSSAYVSSNLFSKPAAYGITGLGGQRKAASSDGSIIVIVAGDTNYTVTNDTTQPYNGQYTNYYDPLTKYTYYTKYGLYITRDSGNTWTKYLVPHPDTPNIGMGHAYMDVKMSTDGKHILVVITGNGNNPNSIAPTAVSVSHDCGYTWASLRYTTGGVYASYLSFANQCCMSADGSKMIVCNSGQNTIWSASKNYGMSWYDISNNTYQSSYPIFCNSDCSIVVSSGSGKNIVRLTSSNNFTSSTITQYTLTADHGGVSTARAMADLLRVCCSPDLTNCFFHYYGAGTTAVYKTIEIYNAITDTWRRVTPTYITPAFVSTPPCIYPTNIFFAYSGKHIYMWFDAFTTVYTYGLLCISTDYGVTFTQVSATGVDVPICVFNNGGYMKLDTSSNIIVYQPKIFAASTFTSLNINGNLTAGSYATSSDYRIKTNITELDGTFSVDKLRPVKYLHTLLNTVQYGVIAHELQEYYPELVCGEKDGDGWQMVNYTGLIAILINEIKRLKQRLAELLRKLD